MDNTSDKNIELDKISRLILWTKNIVADNTLDNI